VNAKTVSETKKSPEKKAAKKTESAASAPRRFAVDRLMTVVLAPVVSKKSTFVADRNRQYVFRVADDATKPQIKAAVELMFKTKVEGVTVSNVKGKERRFGRTIGRKRSWKKAYVRLAEGQEINFAATE
jgi:large subunit ribosomal protein L23